MSKSAFDANIASSKAELAYCWPHWRRQFYEIANPGNAPIASQTLARIAAIYAIEVDLGGQSAQQRRAARQARTRPLADDLKARLGTKLNLISQKGALAKAIRYGLNRWPGFTLFIDDGRIEINSNTVERAIRPIALNRKNALFAGSDGGGEHWATLASIIETAKLNGVNRSSYLANILDRIAQGHPSIASMNSCRGTTQATEGFRNTAYNTSMEIKA